MIKLQQRYYYLFHVWILESFTASKNTFSIFLYNRILPGFLLIIMTISYPAFMRPLFNLKTSLNKRRILLRRTADFTFLELIEKPILLCPRSFGRLHRTSHPFLIGTPFLYIFLKSFDFRIRDFLRKSPSEIIQ